MVTDCLKQSCWDFFFFFWVCWSLQVSGNRTDFAFWKSDLTVKQRGFFLLPFPCYRDSLEKIWKMWTGFWCVLSGVFGDQLNLVQQALPWRNVLEAAPKVSDTSILCEQKPSKALVDPVVWSEILQCQQYPSHEGEQSVFAAAMDWMSRVSTVWKMFLLTVFLLCICQFIY